MDSLQDELQRARHLDVGELADAIESIGFECTRCGGCCTATETAEDDRAAHTATVFPDEIRRLQDDQAAWNDVARPMPFGLTEGEDGLEGETFEWALQTDACGDCVFYAESIEDGERRGACTVHESRPLICQTYPFSVALGGTSQPMGDPVDRAGLVRAHECAGLGRDIDRAHADDLARALKERAIRELEEAIALTSGLADIERAPGEIVVHDSEGAKRPDGTPYRDATER